MCRSSACTKCGTCPKLWSAFKALYDCPASVYQSPHTTAVPGASQGFNVLLQHLHLAQHGVDTHSCAHWLPDLTAWLRPAFLPGLLRGAAQALQGSTIAASWCHPPPAPVGQGGSCGQQSSPADCYAGAGRSCHRSHSHCPAAALQHSRRCGMLGICCAEAAHPGLNCLQPTPKANRALLPECLDHKQRLVAPRPIVTVSDWLQYHTSLTQSLPYTLHHIMLRWYQPASLQTEAIGHAGALAVNMQLACVPRTRVPAEGAPDTGPACRQTARCPHW